MADSRPAGEKIGFRTFADLPGVEILDAEQTSRRWTWFNTAFSLAVPISWSAEVWYRRRQQAVGPGVVFCSVPGEVHTTPSVRRGGAFQVLMVEPAVFQTLLAEQGAGRLVTSWTKVVAPMSPQLAARVAAVLRRDALVSSAMEVQSNVVDLFESLKGELLEQTTGVRAVGANIAERIRECLHSEEGATLDLNGLAAKFGMSRYQVLRAFRSRYGLPPHAYQVCAQVARARALLKAGRAPAEVGVECGFADQSQFGRHYRRLIGVTPGQYARGGAVADSGRRIRTTEALVLGKLALRDGSF